MEQKRVTPAEPYQFGNLGSHGRASGMLIRQYQFPDIYDASEEKRSADSDRLMFANFERYWDCCARAFDGSKIDFDRWVRTKASDQQILDLLIELMLEQEETAGIAWTGYRVLATINRMNGNVVYHLQLFAKKPGSTTEVYTGENAPNVLPGPRSGE